MKYDSNSLTFIKNKNSVSRYNPFLFQFQICQLNRLCTKKHYSLVIQVWQVINNLFFYMKITITKMPVETEIKFCILIFEMQFSQMWNLSNNLTRQLTCFSFKINILEKCNFSFLIFELLFYKQMDWVS
jgi:hypothetical protein